MRTVRGDTGRRSGRSEDARRPFVSTMRGCGRSCSLQHVRGMFRTPSLTSPCARHVAVVPALRRHAVRLRRCSTAAEQSHDADDLVTQPSLQLFGTPTLLAADRQPIASPAAQPRRLAVLALLAEAWPQPVARETLVHEIWPDQNDATGRKLLTQSISVMRRELGDVITAGLRDVQLQPDELRVDLLAFRNAIAQGQDARAVALYRGPFMDGFQLRGSPEFETWVLEHRALLHALRDAAAGRLAEHEMRVDMPAEVGPPVTADAALDAPAGTPWQSPSGETTPGSATPPPVTTTAAATHAWSVRGFAYTAVALLAGIAVATFGNMRRATVAEAGTVTGITITPFAVHGDSAAVAAAAGVDEVLARALDGIAGQRVRRGTGEDGRHVEGSMQFTDDRVRIDAVLAAPGSESTRATASGTRDSLLPLIERVAMQLAPGLLPAGSRTPSAPLIQGTTPTALRAFLAGEAAATRHESEAAYAAFRAATEADSMFAWAWYRRAIAAEWTTRSADADASITMAKARGGTLPDPARQRLEAYALWRRGDARGAESLYRQFVSIDFRDRDAWDELGEIAYHAGPLHGRPIDAARDAWQHVLALDSSNFPALTHALRLALRARDTMTARTLLRRLDAEAPSSVSQAESHALAGLLMGGAAGRRSAAASLDTLPDYSLYFLHAVLAGLMERPEDARAVSQRLVAATRPTAVRAQGHIALAHLAMTAGRRTEAWTHLDHAAALDPLPAAWTRAQFATLPFLQLPQPVIDDAARAMRAAPAASVALPLSLDLIVEAPAAPTITRYLLALLHIASGRPAATAADDTRFACPAAASEVLTQLCADERAGIAAARALAAGQTALADRELSAVARIVPYQLAGRSAFFARSRERWLQADALAHAGRNEEADGWYASMSQGARLDYIYLAPSHLRRGQLRERIGDRGRAAAHYRRVLELWPHPDSAFASLRSEAEAGLRRVAGAD